MRRLRPQGLAGQLLAVLLLALLLGQGLSLLIFADERRVALRAVNREQVLLRTASLVRLLSETPPELHERILDATSSAQLRFQIEGTSAVDPEPRSHSRNRLARRLAELVGEPRDRAVLVDVRDEHRRAAFRCAAVLAIPGGTTVTAEGEVPGVVVREPLGDNGFGYDPIFVPDGDTRTLAQYSDVEKNEISHRGRAFRAMAPLLREHLPAG